MAELSSMQQKIYAYIADCIQTQGYPPSVREIGEAVGLRSPSTVHFHLKNLEEAGAAAVGFNCVGADMMTPYLVSKLRRSVRGPLLCKPNAGIPVIGEDNLPHYPMDPKEFASICAECINMGASLVGGCCGTTPEHIAALK